jgi:hypothetical protein
VGNLRYQSAAPERTYLTAILDHIRAFKAETDHPDLTQSLQNLSGAYSVVQTHQGLVHRDLPYGRFSGDRVERLFSDP